MSIDEVFKAALSNSAIGGGAGGLVRSLSKEEAWQRAIVGTFIGALSATYLTPILVWTLTRYFDIQEADSDMLAGLHGAVAFGLGVVSIGLSSMIESAVDRIIGGKK